MADSSRGDKVAKKKVTKQSIVFFHPDLGIGGAERLIVDAAVGLQQLGHKVTIFTSHCDPRHCFEEARDGTLDVRVHGNTLFPPIFLNRFHILLATLRQIHLVLTVALFSTELRDLKPTIFLADQLSACVPLLRWLFPIDQRILFYCHFPDQLLARRDEGDILSLVKKAYRYPFDWFEGWSMSGSDRIVVNSNFTKSVANRIFPSIENLGIIYPCVDTSTLQHISPEPPLWPNTKILLSINRFERKKDIGLAIRAFHALPISFRNSTRLILAGGYDPRVTENVSYHRELVALAESLSLTTATARTVPTALAIPAETQVLFLLSIPGPFKTTLLRNANLLIYTPSNEHFGIVPVEAMHAGVPVLAANTGGPRESIVDGQTGWLRDPDDVPAWTAVMLDVLRNRSAAELAQMGQNGRARVEAEFSRTTMAERFEAAIVEMKEASRPEFTERGDVGLAMGVVGIFIAAYIGLLVTLMRSQSQPMPIPSPQQMDGRSEL